MKTQSTYSLELDTLLGDCVHVTLAGVNQKRCCCPTGGEAFVRNMREGKSKVMITGHMWYAFGFRFWCEEPLESGLMNWHKF
jgi:hypothetical protein